MRSVHPANSHLRAETSPTSPLGERGSACLFWTVGQAPPGSSSVGRGPGFHPGLSAGNMACGLGEASSTLFSHHLPSALSGAVGYLHSHKSTLSKPLCALWPEEVFWKLLEAEQVRSVSTLKFKMNVYSWASSVTHSRLPGSRMVGKEHAQAPASPRLPFQD